ncbi:energy transducer TonB [Nostoc sp. UCD121]|uniref:energy transducer TonB n=1 Tax=unclassified Nostoc TaxID=2593658 RepID=UPI0016267C5D|nr:MULTISPECIES: energy transducer TonB [unclassified Nostoc]MBC1219527.1 energy transducer TonB [Nostoc sp. UCD120]MBC1276620.1 energy transducer TonB [Nostoc sp. UCD121]MBC1294153.1 energy transducer TonB [Nostoc sp. UCD122]
MSFSGITVEQRSKEVEALKSFLTYSLIGSLALHIGVLSSGISNYLTRVPKEEDEAIELAIVDSPAVEPEKPLEKIPEEPKKEPQIVQKQSIETPQVQKPVQELIEKSTIQPVQQQPQQTIQNPQPVQQQPQQTTQNPQPVNREIAPKPEIPVATVAPQSGGGSGVGLGSGSGIAVGTSSGSGAGGGTGTGSGGGIGSGVGSGIGSGTGSGTGSSTGNQTENRPPVATAPVAPTPPKINSSGNGNGRAACRECNAKYPEAARRRGVEGRVEVAVDTDAQGNVTNVRVARSSGNRDLDEETVRQARDWKLKPAEGGRQGVSIATEFAIQGSRRSRQVQERKRQREVEERTQQTTAANSTEEAPKRRRRELTPPSSNEVRTTRPVISGFSRRLEPQTRESTPTNSSSGASTTRTQGTARESLRRIRREQTTNDSSQKPQPTANRRRRRDNSNQNKLRDSLRRLRQQPQSQPAAPPATSQE